ncbi:MAG: MBL fold metallo-hydrolase [Prevotella sp.]|nr:MBL fold metallo-hydrolase [Prevotella sp.]
MNKKKIKRDGIYFVGESANDVTGSQYLVRFRNRQCLLECGLHQSRTNDYLDSYKINSAKFAFKPKEIDYVFVAHPHIDHCGLLPRLVREGFCGKIIATKETALVMKSLLLNSCFIVNNEARILSKRFKREYAPLYEEEDVYNTLSLIEVHEEYDQIIELDDNISFQWLRNSHCVGAAQLQLILTSQGIKRKILYTSDIGALNTNNHFVDVTEIPKFFNDVVIMESTYGDAKKPNLKGRNFDIVHFKTAIDTVLERGGSVVLPCFSFSRTQEILTTIYDIYADDENFKTQVVVDSKLSCEISDLYFSLLKGEDLDLWDKVYHWENVKFISESADSKECLADNKPKIIISSSGFCTNGRIVNYLKKYIKDTNSMIIFSGYTGDNNSYLSYRIKNGREYKTISINKEKVPNRADCITLSTFSSHANHDDLVKYGSSLKTNKVVLVHGSAESKKCLSEKLKTAISKNNKTYRVLSAFKGMVIHL